MFTHRIWICIAMVAVLGSVACGQPRVAFWAASSERPEDLVGWFFRKRTGWPGQFDREKERLRENAERCVPVFRAIMTLPRDPEEWDFSNADGARPYNELSSVLAHRLVPLLGRERAEPLLEQMFVDAVRLFRETDKRLQPLEQRWERRNVAETRWSDEDEARLRRLGQLRTTWSGLMGAAIGIAGELQSPILVEPLLEFYESGQDHHQGAFTRYLFPFAAEREDVIPRLRKVQEDPETPPRIRMEIQQSFDWWKSLHEPQKPSKHEQSQREAPKGPM